MEPKANSEGVARALAAAAALRGDTGDAIFGATPVAVADDAAGAGDEVGSGAGLLMAKLAIVFATLAVDLAAFAAGVSSCSSKIDSPSIDPLRPPEPLPKAGGIFVGGRSNPEAELVPEATEGDEVREDSDGLPTVAGTGAATGFGVGVTTGRLCPGAADAGLPSVVTAASPKARTGTVEFVVVRRGATSSTLGAGDEENDWAASAFFSANRLLSRSRLRSFSSSLDNRCSSSNSLQEMKWVSERRRTKTLYEL